MSEQPKEKVTMFFKNLTSQIFETPSVKNIVGEFFNDFKSDTDQPISKTLMESMYAYAYHFYQQGRLDEAEVLFRFLCIYDVNNADYSFGLAAVYQLKKKYDKAIDIYSIVYTLDNPNPRALFHAGQCHLLNKKKQEAKRCFEAVIAESQDKWLLERSQQYLSLINLELKNQIIKIGELSI